MSSLEQVILVDDADRVLGSMEKLAAHKEGMLHRAFSVFIFNSQGELLLQRRAMTKYHSPGLWSNTCCGHPRPGEDLAAAAQRRLMEEMGMRCELKPAFHFIYRAELEDGMIEHELDHVFIGTSDNAPVPDPSEVSDERYIVRGTLASELQYHPTRFSIWLPLCYERAWDAFEGRG